MFATIRRAFGLNLIVLGCLGLSACESTYEDTKGWANRLEASFLKEMERAFQEPEPKPMRPQSGPGWETDGAPGSRQAPPAPGVVAEAAAKMAGAPQGKNSNSAEADGPTKMANAVAQPKEAGSASNDPTGPTAADPGDRPQPAVTQTAKGKPATNGPDAASMDPTGPKAAAAKGAQAPLPKLKPSKGSEAKPNDPAGAADQSQTEKTSLVIHLSSLRSEAAAKKEWQALRKAFPDQLSTMSPRFRRTEIAKRGTFYRVLAGPVPSKQAASRICSALKAKKQYCQVMTAPPSA